MGISVRVSGGTVDVILGINVPRIKKCTTDLVHLVFDKSELSIYNLHRIVDPRIDICYCICRVRL